MQLVGWTPGCRTIVCRGRPRELRDALTDRPVSTDLWVYVLEAPAERALDARLPEAEFPDLLTVALQYVSEAPDIVSSDGLRIAGDASYGPLSPEGWRRWGGDFNDFLGIAWRGPDGIVRPPRPEFANAVDCSGYVRLVFGHRFRVPLSYEPAAGFLPRHSWEMAEASIGVDLGVPRDGQIKGLRTGDLLFFQPPDRDRVSHVGIYLGVDAGGERRFVHSASSPDGPTIGDRSSGHPPVLDSPYWQSRFVRARRV